jgi:hypothetical protein
MPRGQHDGSLRPYSRLSRPEPILFFRSSSSSVLTRLSGPLFRPLLLRKSDSAGNALLDIIREILMNICKGPDGWNNITYTILWSPLSLVSTRKIKELLEIKSNGSGLQSRDCSCRGSVTLTSWHPRFPKVGTNFAGSRSVGIVRSRTQDTEVFLVFYYCRIKSGIHFMLSSY